MKTVSTENSAKFLLRRALVLGGSGFIGSHLITRLKSEGFWVRSIDIVPNEWGYNDADEFVLADLRDQSVYPKVFDLEDKEFKIFDECYSLQALMGGAGFIFTGDNDADIVHNNALTHLNVLDAAVRYKVGKIFLASSACCYASFNQTDPNNPLCSEDSAWPAQPDSPYGLEKLFAETTYSAFARNKGLNVRIARFHNIYAGLTHFENGKEKAPAALCRKVALAKNGEDIEVWGTGKQTRSFLYIDECLEGIRRLMDSDVTVPLNIGSEEMVTIDELANMIIKISGKKIGIKHIPGPVGVMGRNSDNRLIREKLGWEPKYGLYQGLEKTYAWIYSQVHKS